VVTDYADARFGQRVESRTLAALRRDERRAWDKSSARPTYIVPALEGRYFQPVRGLFALSDRPPRPRPGSGGPGERAASRRVCQRALLPDRRRRICARIDTSRVLSGTSVEMPFGQ
jgi:hypothetical protein